MVHSEFCVIFILIGTLFVASAFPGKREGKDFLFCVH